MRIDLPSGGWVELRPEEEIRGLRRAIRKPLTEDMTLGERANAGHAAIMGKVITAWEVPYLPGAPLPKDDPSIVDELDDPDNDVLEKHMERITQSAFGAEVTPDDHDKPGSPTAPASD